MTTMPNDISIPNVLRQCMQLIALFPLLSVYGYQAYSHYHDGKSLYIHHARPEAVHRGEHPRACCARTAQLHRAGGPRAGHLP